MIGEPAKRLHSSSCPGGSNALHDRGVRMLRAPRPRRHTLPVRRPSKPTRQAGPPGCPSTRGGSQARHRAPTENATARHAESAEHRADDQQALQPSSDHRGALDLPYPARAPRRPPIPQPDDGAGSCALHRRHSPHRRPRSRPPRFQRGHHDEHPARPSPAPSVEQPLAAKAALVRRWRQLPDGSRRLTPSPRGVLHFLRRLTASDPGKADVLRRLTASLRGCSTLSKRPPRASRVRPTSFEGMSCPTGVRSVRPDPPAKGRPAPRHRTNRVRSDTAAPRL